MTRARIRPLREWIPAVSPRYTAPDHLAPILQTFEAIARGEAIERCCSAPPRHWKTATLEHGVVWLLSQDPRRRIIWSSYSQRFAERSSRRIRELALRVGVPIADDARARSNWRTGVGDGGLWVTSIGGSVTGEGSDLFIVDDPVKGRAEAESATIRDRIYDWWNDDAYTRCEPGGSRLVVSARWHEDDLIGRLVADGWTFDRIPAIDDEGRALCPARYPLTALRTIEAQLGEYGFSSLYQGRPRPRGGLVFAGDVLFYEALPPTYAIGKGVDLAYTARTSRDHSAGVVVLHADGVYFVVDVTRAQTSVDHFVPRLRQQSYRWPGRYLFYASSTEQGIAQLLKLLPDRDSVSIDARIARTDKFTRAQPVAAAWNAGKIFLPRTAPWLDAFVNELKSFTGVNDRRDDQVDALAAAFDDVAMRARHRAQRAPEIITFESQFADFGSSLFDDGASHNTGHIAGDLSQFANEFARMGR